MSKYHSTLELAKKIKKTRITVWRLIDEGKIKAEMIGKSYMITEKEFQKAIKLFSK